MCPNAGAPARRIASVAALLAGAMLTAPAVAATAPPAKPATTAAAAKPPEGPRSADAATRAAAERLEPLARAAFWAQESRLDPTDVTAGIKLAA
ncbi:hypothetical protein BH09PSE2_BH09PSE2_11070 [soil metagenome]